MLNAAEFRYFQIVIGKSTQNDVNHRNSVTAPSVSCRESLYGDPSNYRGQKYCTAGAWNGLPIAGQTPHSGTPGVFS